MNEKLDSHIDYSKSSYWEEFRPSRRHEKVKFEKNFYDFEMIPKDNGLKIDYCEEYIEEEMPTLRDLRKDSPEQTEWSLTFKDWKFMPSHTQPVFEVLNIGGERRHKNVNLEKSFDDLQMIPKENGLKIDYCKEYIEEETPTLRDIRKVRSEWDLTNNEDYVALAGIVKKDEIEVRISAVEDLLTKALDELQCLKSDLKKIKTAHLGEAEVGIQEREKVYD